MSTGLGSSKKGSKTPDASMVTRMRRVVAQNMGDNSYSTDLKKNGFRSSVSVLDTVVSSATSLTLSKLTAPVVYVPYAPTILDVVAGNASATLYFVEASPGLTVTTNYEYSVDNGLTWTAVSPASTISPITITGLTNGTTYQVVLRAVNSYGAGETSNMMSVVPVTIPSAPTSVSATAGNTQATVTFTPGSSGGSAITGFTVTSSPGDIQATGSSSPITVTGLTNGQSYTFIVIATNAVGNSSPSSASNSVTPVSPVTTPSAPMNLTVYRNAGSYVMVEFTAPTNDGGSAITNYEYSTNNGSSYTAFSPPVTSTLVEIAGLTGGTTYNIKLRAVNIAGSGTASSTLPVVAATPPGTPVLQTILADDMALYVYFTAGAGGTPTNYEYKLNSDGYVELSPATTTSPIKITRRFNGAALQNGASYLVTLRARNDAGTSNDSNTLAKIPVNPSTASPYLYYDPSNSSSYSGSGTTVSNIGSYGAKNGTITGSVTYNAGVKGGVFDFPGTNGSVITFTSLDFGNSISVAAWVYPRSKADINGLFTNAGANVSTNGFKFQWNWWLTSSRGMSFQAGNGTNGNDDNTPANVISYDTWQHFGYVFDKTNQKIIFFLNGIPAAVATDVTTVANINTNAAFNIGGYIGGSYTMNARLGYIKIYNSLLDATQMYADYNNTRSRFL